MRDVITERDARILQEAWNSVQEAQQLVEEARAMMVLVGVNFARRQTRKPQPNTVEEPQQVG